MIKNKFLFAFILLFLINIYPQDSLYFEQLSLQEGVAHNLTYTMIEDSKGFLWFGTMYGLVRYEGSRYTIFKHNPEDEKSISFDDIVSLFEDSKGNIWIGTWGGGLNKYDPFTGEFTRFIADKNDKKGLNDNIVWAITEDKKGNIWIGTEHGGLNKYDPAKDEFTYFKHDESNSNSILSNSVKSLLVDSKGNLWAGCSKGLSKYDFGSRQLNNFVYNENDTRSISHGPVNVIFEDSKKNIWAGTSSGLNRFDGKYTFERFTSDETPNSLSNNFINCITEDDKGNFWIGTNNGLNYFDTNKKITRYYHNPENPHSLSGNIIRNVIIDFAGTLWVNVYNSGINKSFNPAPEYFHNISRIENNNNSLSNSYVSSLTEGIDYNVWIGTANGLNMYDVINKTITRLPLDLQPQKNFISALETDYDGNIWIGTRAGLKVYNPFSKIFIEQEYDVFTDSQLFSNYITTILIDSLTVWIGTYNNGLYKLDRKNNTLTKFSYEEKNFNSFHSDFIITLYKDRQGKIWAGTYGGFLKYNGKNSFIPYTNDPDDKTSLSNNYVFCIFEDSRNELWIGTANGLNRFNPDDATFEHFFEKDGLPNSVICSIVEDSQNNLWFSTNKGISKFNYNERTFINYDLNDGLPSNTFNIGAGLKGRNANILFGSRKGCIIFYPGQMKLSDFNPPVYISSIKKSGSEGKSSFATSFNDEIKIYNDENTIEINFASLDYTDPAKNKIFYMLQGINPDWVDAGISKSVTFNNLKPGEYLLKVKGTNSHGIFSSNTAELKLIVLPPFWQTWWFRILVLLVLAVLIFYFVRNKVVSKIKKEIEIQRIREEESEKIRKQTAADFHDELGHRLTRISLLTETIRKKLHNTFQEIDPLLKSISENSQILFDGTRDFIWAIDPSQDNLYDLVVRLKDFGDELFHGTDIKFNIKGLDESLQKYSLNVEWKRQITLIFKEALNNTLKHSKCRNVTLEANVRKDEELEIVLFDDGIGFSVEESSDGNGLKNMKRRAEKIQGTLDIDSRSQIGTKILFKGNIPLNYIDYHRKVA